jgi:hypothetical protein
MDGHLHITSNALAMREFSFRALTALASIEYTLGFPIAGSPSVHWKFRCNERIRFRER